MNILAFDTCFDACSVAVQRAGSDQVIVERELMRRGHAEVLVPMIERGMRAAELTFDRLDRIAVTHGPGTFTGARVGMSAALGLSFAHNVPVVTCSSLQCVARAAIAQLADQADAYEGILVVRDAKRERVFVEGSDMSGMELYAPALLGLDEARHIAKSRRWFALGSGVALLGGDASELDRLAAERLEAMPGVMEPDARYMLQDAASRAPTAAPTPLYLRPPDATPSTRPPLARLTATPSVNV